MHIELVWPPDYLLFKYMQSLAYGSIPFGARNWMEHGTAYLISNKALSSPKFQTKKTWANFDKFWPEHPYFRGLLWALQWTDFRPVFTKVLRIWWSFRKSGWKSLSLIPRRGVLNATTKWLLNSRQFNACKEMVLPASTWRSSTHLSNAAELHLQNDATLPRLCLRV